MKKIFLAILLTGLIFSSYGQKYKAVCIAFYNLENLFDTIDDPGKRDGEFTPQGAKHWNTEKYYHKLDNLAKVLSEIGTEVVPTGAAVIGVAEVEHRNVLEDLAKRPAIANRHYQIIHYESPDERGIDVALLYNPKIFHPVNSRIKRVILPDGDHTRDILYVSGKLDGETFHFIVTHWPSRRGGKERSEPLRELVASKVREIVDSVLKSDPMAKIIVMGDLNDDPVDPSVKKDMKSVGSIKEMKPDLMFNPMEEKFKKGLGTLAYNDVWNLFDQFMLSYGLVQGDYSTYQFKLAKRFTKKYLFQKTGRFKGYPYRTFVGNNFLGGYSDHLPVYLILIKKAK